MFWRHSKLCCETQAELEDRPPEVAPSPQPAISSIAQVTPRIAEVPQTRVISDFETRR